VVLRAAVGRNKLNNLMKQMATGANLPDLASKRITNTSVRKHLCQKLQDNSIPDTQAVHITGYKNPSSLNNYRTLNSKKKHEMSALLPRNTGDIASTVNENSSSSANSFQNTEHTSFAQSVSGAANMNPSDIFHAIFYGSTISGGTFNININFTDSKDRAHDN